MPAATAAATAPVAAAAASVAAPAAPVRLERRGYFWQITLSGAVATVAQGRVGSTGRVSVMHLAPAKDAPAWANAAIADKLAAGYLRVAAPVAPSVAQSQMQSQSQPQPQPQPRPQPRRSARKRTAPVAYAPEGLGGPRGKKVKVEAGKAKGEEGKKVKSKRQKVKGGMTKVKRGLKGEKAVDTGRALGVIDPASGLSGTIVVAEDANGVTAAHDVMLVLIDKMANHDKYIVLQVIKTDSEPEKYVFYRRWGRTGTSGVCLTECPEGGEEGALNAFAKLFHEKTGLNWEERNGPAVHGKYRFVKQDLAAKAEAAMSAAPSWQYWVDDGVDGKSTGWYDYDALGNTMAEQLYTEFQNNQWLCERIVYSGSWIYLVNLESMTQINIKHPNHKQRHIRRVEPNEVPDNADPTQDFPSTTPVAVNNAMGMKSKKPNVKPTQTKAPSHIVPPAPAVVPAAAKSETMAEPSAEESAADLVIPVDDSCPNAQAYEVVDDFDATLNQSNIMNGNNNNKYYKIQMLKKKDADVYRVWLRWGRVGETRGTQTRLLGPFKNADEAEKVFSAKFSDKTKNKWSDRANFVAKTGKYEMLQIDHSVKKEEVTPLVMKLTASDDPNVQYLPSTLPDETRDLIQLLFEKDVYTDALKEFDIDVRKMPLGALSTEQIQKGVAVLEELEEELEGASLRRRLELLSSKFYTTLPHDFGRRRPPVIASKVMLQRCYDMCNVLLDMEKATTIMSEAAERSGQEKGTEMKPHPTEAQYASLKAELRLVDLGSEEHDIIATAFHRTKGRHQSTKLLNVWRVEREGEGSRFDAVKNDNHALLWHGSHIGAISAILSTGLRIMPHSGGRVGRGIYLASENSKSQGYTTPASGSRIGCMFLAEAALGRTYEIYKDDSTLKKAPEGFDSVHACGRQTPGGYRDLKLDDRTVKVPVDAPTNNLKANNSSFHQDEFLIYNESQARIRYVITVKK